MASALATWLATLTEQQLAAVLAHRPDALRGPEPRSLSELAERLQHPGSVYEALATLNVPCLQAIEALLALGRDPTAARLAELLDSAGSAEAGTSEAAHAAHVGAVLGELAQHALVWPRGDRLQVASAARSAFPNPLGLGTPARTLLVERTVAELHAMQSTLGLPRGGAKQAAVESIAERLGDARFVRERVAALPAPAREHLERLAVAPDEDDEDFDIDGYAAQRAAERVLVEHGLLIGATWGPQTYLPAEVARALRGDDFRAPFTAAHPVIDWDEVGAEAIDAEAGIRAAEFAERAATLLDIIAAAPVTRLKSGGIGARELARIGKAAGATEPVTRLIVELAAAAGLLDAHSEHAMVTPAFDEWREREPAGRLSPLLRAWWLLPGTPTATRDQDGKSMPALGWRAPCESCGEGRQLFVATVASAPEGHGARFPEDVVFAAWWKRPAIHLPRGADDAPPLAWSEAEAVGVIARGAVTSVGRALLADDPDAVDAALVRLLPTSTQAAVFGSDLTAVVGGAPSARVRALLDCSAEREGHGAATVWRFTPASIRRALDAGVTAADLEDDLAEIAASGLPQPLRYLIGDVARRHGHLRVAAAVCCIHTPDAALLAEVVAHRKLRALKLRLVAPTVAISPSPVGAAVTALRAAGYLPLAEDPDGAVKVERRAGQRAAARRARPAGRPTPTQPHDPALIARRLIGQRATAPASPDSPVSPAAPASPTEATLAEWASALGSAEIRQLAHAIDRNLPVRIEYRAASGGYSARVVSDLQLQPPFLVGWCHLRDDERMFTLSRIQSAVAV